MHKSKILIIEDTQSIRDELRDILRFEGYEVITAENGQEGIDRAKEFLPDLILCDIMMPIKDGRQVFSEIKNEVTFPVLVCDRDLHSHPFKGEKHSCHHPLPMILLSFLCTFPRH